MCLRIVWMVLNSIGTSQVKSNQTWGCLNYILWNCEINQCKIFFLQGLTTFFPSWKSFVFISTRWRYQLVNFLSIKIINIESIASQCFGNCVSLKMITNLFVLNSETIFKVKRNDLLHALNSLLNLLLRIKVE